MSKSVVVSAAGKVLICGGYLIVEKGNPGVSIAVDCKFNCRGRAKEVPNTTNVTTDITVLVKSLQFGSTQEIKLKKDGDQWEFSNEQSISNFIAAAVKYGITEAAGMTVPDVIELELFADNSFYSQANYLKSQGQEVTYNNLVNVPASNKIVGDLGKTGLGSSAGLTASIVGCLFEVLGKSALENKSDVHACAQRAHCAAQSKIGSGFDVATAVYGSCVYSRFSPSCINEKNSEWDHEISPILLPGHFRLLLADINKGSSTPGMVSTVMKWKKSGDNETRPEWESLKAANKDIVSILSTVSGGLREVDGLSELPSNQWESLGESAAIYIKLRDALAKARVLLRKMGELSGAAIEPQQQTELIDATLKSVPGVLAAGCPGAGGFDAIFAICVSDTSRDATITFWENYSNNNFGVTPKSVCALPLSQSATGMEVIWS
eukprot:TRINITY_DN10014_c0_g1_i1.p1 TRINITY_DN10014_c0_g1~~TRINITY_DN10014_c0_g1_i1.p1  ORF type:complete len:435 (+),score=75.35 TRINITY_DN10014_c0_g1_i1:115-1419(+)